MSSSTGMDTPRSTTSDCSNGIRDEARALFYELYHLIYIAQQSYRPASALFNNDVHREALRNIVDELKNEIKIFENKTINALWLIKNTAKGRLKARLEKVKERQNLRQLSDAEEKLEEAWRRYTREMADVREEVADYELSRNMAGERKHAVNEEWEKALAKFEKVQKAAS
ncbi:hypothetical protein H2200_000026 [Cladophialophora chaetospira]|uniref:Uncharacterized protein n=1 Tax=Cladophialophora chaetospira TaxID=386627 RepID=A0AA38XMM9_9EURO|nr:hypothetical protein H2200_000026 [Cladophialophora chaetospira]